MPLAVILQRLRAVHGPVKLGPPWPPLDELIATILSQNTSDANSAAAYAALRRRFSTWDAVQKAPIAAVVAAIHRAGLSRQKAPRIQAILRRVHAERGNLSLDFLRDLPVDEALAYLRRFPGVGPKTAACVLLFACRQPVLPVDTHVHRVSRRLGLIGPRTMAEQAHDVLAGVVPPAHVLAFHILLIRHGRAVCTARRPRCAACVLRDGCPEGRRQLAARRKGAATVAAASGLFAHGVAPACDETARSCNES
jgi:endonuclease-3